MMLYPWKRIHLYVLLLAGLLFLLEACHKQDPPQTPFSSTQGHRQSIINGQPDLSTPAIGTLALFSKGKWQAAGCTGTLFHPRLVLTAAHCVDDIQKPYAHRFAFRIDFNDPTAKQGYRSEYAPY
ncbi:MAG: trypsin-like serine protease, partial [Myxococcota bacterium]